MKYCNEGKDNGRRGKNARTIRGRKKEEGKHDIEERNETGKEMGG